MWAVAVDLSFQMLRSGVADFPGSRVQTDARVLPFSSSSIDWVWANASFVHLSIGDALVALREIYQVLKKSGPLHISVKRGKGNEWNSRRYDEPR